MNYRVIASLFLLLPLLFGSSNAPQAAPEYSHPLISPPSIGEITDGTIPPPAVTDTDVTIHGTMWQPEKRSLFSVWSPKGWATQAKIKAVGSQWVHISVPIMSQMEGRTQYVNTTEFCARSTNPTVSHPQHVDVYTGDTVFFSYEIAWPNDTAVCCFSMNIGHNWKADLGISVLLHFGNIADSIYLYKAWTRSSD